MGPNILTLAGFIFTILCAVCIGLQWMPVAIVFIIFAGACDILDGAVARLANQRTTFGAVLDSTLDRYSDTALYMGIVFYFLGNSTYVVLSILALAGSLATSYVRARAENLVQECRAGFWERGERMAYVLIGLVFNHLAIVVIVLAIFTNITVLQRLFYARWELARAADKPVWPKSSEVADLVFWNYDRGTRQYDVAVIVFFVIAVVVRL
jgi:phosphatidylglycerophosphate synthase